LPPMKEENKSSMLSRGKNIYLKFITVL